MRVSYYLWPLLLAATAAQAQTPSIRQTGNAGRDNIQALVDGSSAMLPRGESAGVKGSPYLENRWLETRLQLSNKAVVEPVLFKYDILEQRLLVRPPKHPNDSIQLNRGTVNSFIIESPTAAQPARQRHFRLFVEAPDRDEQGAYVEVVHEGAYTLLKRYTKSMRKANYQQAYSSGNRYDEIEDRNQYYLLRPDQTLVPLKLTLKMLQAAAPELAPALKAAPGASRAKTDAEWAAVLAAVDAH